VNASSPAVTLGDIYDIEQGDRELLAFINTVAHQQRQRDFPNAPSSIAWLRRSPRLLPLPDPMPATDLVEPRAR
jgi:hypothetical protein